MARRDVATGAAVLGVEKEAATAFGAHALELGHSRVDVAEIDDGHGVQAIGVIRELVGEVRVAPRRGAGTIRAQELDHLPIAAGVHQRVRDAEPVHPRDTLARCRLMARVNGGRTLVVDAASGEVRDQGGRFGPAMRGQPGEQITRERMCEPVEGLGQSVLKAFEWMAARRERRRFPVRVDIDDHRVTLHVVPRHQGTRPLNHVVGESDEAPGVALARGYHAAAA